LFPAVILTVVAGVLFGPVVAVSRVLRRRSDRQNA
jgi:uncharacterized membrane protein YdjX (TVP38/TMEM64 family)